MHIHILFLLLVSLLEVFWEFRKCGKFYLFLLPIIWIAVILSLTLESDFLIFDASAKRSGAGTVFCATTDEWIKKIAMQAERINLNFVILHCFASDVFCKKIKYQLWVIIGSYIKVMHEMTVIIINFIFKILNAKLKIHMIIVTFKCWYYCWYFPFIDM